MDVIMTTAEVRLQPEIPPWPLRHHRIRAPSVPQTLFSSLAKTVPDFSQMAGEGNAQCLLNVLVGKLLLTYYLNLSRCHLDIRATYYTWEMRKIKHYFLLLLLARDTYLNIFGWDEATACPGFIIYSRQELPSSLPTCFCFSHYNGKSLCKIVTN